MARKKKGAPPGFVRVTEEEFADELVRRMEEIESGKVKTIPWEVVKRELAEERKRRRGGH